jgi:hypothetical protein
MRRGITGRLLRKNIGRADNLAILILSTSYNITSPFYGQYGGSMELNGRIFSTAARFNTAVEAKAELARQGYKFIAGIDWGQSLHPGHSPGANTTVLAGQKQVFESFEQKLSNLALSYGIGSVLQYTIRPHGSRGGFIGNLNVDDQLFKTYSLAPTAARAKEIVAEKAHSFFQVATKARVMVPIPGFETLRNALGFQTFGPARVHISGPATLQIDVCNNQGQIVDVLTFDMSVLGKLSTLLQLNYHQNPQWFERTDVIVRGEPMYACLLRWETGVETFGDLSKGYPDPNFARFAAAEPASAWLEKYFVRKDEKRASLSSGSGTSGHGDGTHYVPLRHSIVGKELPRLATTPATAKLHAASAVSSDCRFDGDHGHNHSYNCNNNYGPADRYRPNGPRFLRPSNFWRSENKRAGDLLLKANETVK